jgi:two-component sensor histidine kinase
MPIALIVNELVSNCMKHAFPGGRTGRILVSIREAALSPGAGDAWLLEVEDDGIGIEEAGEKAECIDKGIGTELVQALTGQLRGTLSRCPGASGRGTLVSMRFPRQR